MGRHSKSKKKAEETSKGGYHHTLHSPGGLQRTGVAKPSMKPGHSSVENKSNLASPVSFNESQTKKPAAELNFDTSKSPSNRYYSNVDEQNNAMQALPSTFEDGASQILLGSHQAKRKDVKQLHGSPSHDSTNYAYNLNGEGLSQIMSETNPSSNHLYLANAFDTMHNTMHRSPTQNDVLLKLLQQQQFLSMQHLNPFGYNGVASSMHNGATIARLERPGGGRAAIPVGLGADMSSVSTGLHPPEQQLHRLKPYLAATAQSVQPSIPYESLLEARMASLGVPVEGKLDVVQSFIAKELQS